MLSLTAEQRELVRLLREVAESELAENAFTWNGSFPWENIELLAEHGLVGLNFPTRYGGGGMSEFEAMLALEIVGSVCPDTALALFSLSLGSTPAINQFGTEAAKDRYLRPVCSGESVVAIAISEPDAGSDLNAMTTRFERDDGDGFHITGEKTWVGDVKYADAAVVWGKFADGSLGSAIVDLDDDGIGVVNHYENMFGQTQTHFTMDEVYVPPENMLVQGRNALKQQLESFNWERCASAAFSVGIARSALHNSVSHANERVQFDQAITDFQGIQWKIADMATEIEATRSLAYRAAINAQHASTGTPDRLESSITKLHSGQMVERVVSEALQIVGARGYQSGHPLEYLYRLQRSRRIAGGTDEIMKNNIAAVVIEQEGLSDL